MKHLLQSVLIFTTFLCLSFSLAAQTSSGGFGSSFSNQDIEYIYWCDLVSGEQQTIYEVRKGAKSSIFYDDNGNIVTPSSNATIGKCIPKSLLDKKCFAISGGPQYTVYYYTDGSQDAFVLNGVNLQPTSLPANGLTEICCDECKPCFYYAGCFPTKVSGGQQITQVLLSDGTIAPLSYPVSYLDLNDEITALYGGYVLSIWASSQNGAAGCAPSSDYMEYQFYDLSVEISEISFIVGPPLEVKKSASCNSGSESINTECKKACVKGVSIDVTIGYNQDGSVEWYADEYGNLLTEPDFKSDCPPLSCESQSQTLCADGDWGSISDGTEIILIINTCTDGSSEIVSAALLSNPTTSITLPNGIVFKPCDNDIQTELIGCVVDEDGVKWDAILINGTDFAYLNQETGQYGVPNGDLTRCDEDLEIVSAIAGKHCINVDGEVFEAFLFVASDKSICAKPVGSDNVYLQQEYNIVSCCEPPLVQSTYFNGFTVNRPSGLNSGWNNQIINSPPALNGDFELCFTPSALTGNTPNMIGITSDPNANTSYNTIDCALYLRDLFGTEAMYHYANGSYQGFIGNVAFSGQEICFKRVGATLTFLLNGSPMVYNGGSTPVTCNIGTGTVFLDDSHYYAAGTWGSGSITYSDFILVQRDPVVIKSVSDCNSCTCNDTPSFEQLTGTSQTYSNYCGFSIEVLSGTVDVTINGNTSTLGCTQGFDLTKTCHYYNGDITIDASNGSATILTVN